MEKLIYALCLMLMAFTARAQQDFSWPENKKGAIVLTYDDALVSQLENAVPQLNRHKLKGTFYLDGGMREEEMDRWRKVSMQGHELGNHTLYHPCSKERFNAHPRFTSESYDPYAILQEIGMMSRILFAIDGQRRRTYAYPCSETVVGGVDYSDSLRQSGLITYARIGGDEDAVITDFHSLDPLQVPAFALMNNQDEQAMIQFVKRVQQEGGLGVLMFHGVGGDYLEVSSEAHEALLGYLSEHQDEIWVGTFREVMDYVKAQQNP